MTKPLSLLEMARRDAQELHKKISGSADKAAAKTWAEVRALQADTLALAVRM